MKLQEIQTGKGKSFPYQIRIVGPAGVMYALGPNDRRVDPEDAIGFQTREEAEEKLAEVEKKFRDQGFKILDVINAEDPEANEFRDSEWVRARRP